MNGDAMVVLKNLIEVCGWGTAQTDHCSLFGLLSTSHLTYILSLSGITAASTLADSSIPLYSIPVTHQNSTRGGVEVLGDLLGGGKVGRMLSATLPNECSFVEELFLESSQRLNELQYPLDVRKRFFFHGSTSVFSFLFFFLIYSHVHDQLEKCC